MNAPEKKIYESPACLMKCWDGIPEPPDIFQEPPKRVHFSEAGSTIIYAYLATQGDQRDVWWAKEELDEFRKKAKKEAKDFRESETECVQALRTFFQDCKNKEQRNLSSLSAQRIMNLSASPVRGLESRLNGSIWLHRIIHLQRLITVQHSTRARNSCLEEQAFLEQALRSCSCHTSRASRAFARLLAHGDCLQVVAMLLQERQEFESSNNTI
jgi:hypothetical protein